MTKQLTPLEAYIQLLSKLGTSTRWTNRNELNIIETALKDFEWLKSKISIDWFDKLPTDDKFRVMKIMGVEYDETYTK